MSSLCQLLYPGIESESFDNPISLIGPQKKEIEKKEQFCEGLRDMFGIVLPGPRPSLLGLTKYTVVPIALFASNQSGAWNLTNEIATPNCRTLALWPRAICIKMTHTRCEFRFRPGHALGHAPGHVLGQGHGLGRNRPPLPTKGGRDLVPDPQEEEGAHGRGAVRQSDREGR